MGAVPYAEWLARGRAHQQESRPIDAMLCYQRAIRAAPRAVDSRFHLGEVLWQLGRLKEAINAWRQACDVAPANLTVLLPLSESLLVTGDVAGARDVAARALAVKPDHSYALLLHGIASLRLAEAADHDGAVAHLLSSIERAPKLIAVPTLAGPLALALDAAPEMPRRGEMLARLFRMPDLIGKGSALLLALALEYGRIDAGADAAAARGALLRAALARAYSADEHEALRRIAYSAVLAGDAAASELAAYYAQLCAHVWRAYYPLAWPRRCAGERLRVVAIAGTVADSGAAALLAKLTAATESGCDVTLALMGMAEAQVPPDDTLRVRALPALVLPRIPDASDARRIAALDPDVLIDLAGLSAAAGILLAQRPARRVITVSGLAAPNVAPLVDRTLPTVDALPALLAEMRTEVEHATLCRLRPQAVAQVWEEAVRAHQQGDFDAARARYGQVLELQPQYAPAYHLRGALSRTHGNLEDARADFAAALAAAPGYVDVRLAAAKLALDMGDAAAAARVCAEGLELAPREVELVRTLGLAELARRNAAASVELFSTAIALAPNDGDTHYNQGVALQTTRDYTAAARAYQRALALQPDLIAAEFNLGVIFQDQGNAEAAIGAYTNVLARDPHRIAAYKNLGETLAAAGRIDAWFANFRRFEAHCPAALALAVQALEVLQHRGDLAGVERYLEGLRLERYRASDEVDLCDNLEQLLYLLLFFDVEPELVHTFAKTYDAAAPRVYGGPLPQPASRRPGKIRVGYLSADLRNHVMGKMIWQALRHHDRSRFSLFFYSTSAQRDEWTDRFVGVADRFGVVADLTERDAALQIAGDDLDIIVDLSTHTRGARPGILARKPARIAITHVASAGTLGLSTIDFKLTDGYADLPEHQAHQIETMLPMAGCVYPFRHVAAAATHPFHRNALGIAADVVLVGAFVTPLKLSRRCLELWRNVLERIPRARLVFSPTRPAFAASYRHLAAAAGIAPARLLFLPQGGNDAENQARYTLIDFVLDPMPFGGVNGTLEALDMGVPVVTLVGGRHGERTSYSILANLGVLATVAQSGREYVDIAVRLANDAAFMRDVRAAIAAGLASSVLTDAAGHTRNLEAAYREALRQKAPAVLRDAEAA